MGMFDYFYSSHYLGKDYTNSLCQTKDLGQTMQQFWLDPNGQLWLIDYTRTQKTVIYKPGDPEYDHSCPWNNIDWVETGCNGRVSPFRESGEVEIYPADTTWEADFFSRLRLYFHEGILLGCEDLTLYLLTPP